MSSAERQKERLHIGRYQVVHPLGQGAMGEVLLAYDPVLDRHVAIKYLRRDLELSDEHHKALTARLWQEARASARVSHPHIVALHDMGEDEQLGPYLVFEHVEGPTLKERLTRGPLKPHRAARLARELGDALGAAHAASVVHRDVKPENVIIHRSGSKIADFGIARLPNSTLTQRGSLLGTPAYSAPETLAGAQFSALSDQFSLAATLYEAVFGRRAFPGDDALQVANRVRLDEPKRAAAELGLDAEVDRVLARALSKRPKDRFENCVQLGLALAGALEKTAHPTSPRGLIGPQDTLSAVSTEARQPTPGRFNAWPMVVGVGLAAAGLYFVFSGSLPGEAPAAAASPRPSLEQAPATVEASRSNWIPAREDAPAASAPVATEVGHVRVVRPTLTPAQGATKRTPEASSGSSPAEPAVGKALH